MNKYYIKSPERFQVQIKMTNISIIMIQIVSQPCSSIAMPRVYYI